MYVGTCVLSEAKERKFFSKQGLNYDKAPFNLHSTSSQERVKKDGKGALVSLLVSSQREDQNKTPVPEEGKKIPKSFVLKSGRVGESVTQLRKDVRLVMEPNTAVNLKVTHFLVFSATDIGTYMRLIKVPQGPTLTFRIHSYTLIRDIVRSQLRPHIMHGIDKLAPPLLILNNFPTDETGKLMAVMFQNLFPPLAIQTMKLKDCRRVVLLSYNKDTKHIEFRHYHITASPVGINRRVKKVIKGKIPNLSRLDDISDYILGTGGAATSDSEAEDTPETRLELTQEYFGRGNTGAAPQTAIRLKELGPRMSMQLIRVQAGFCDGTVLFNEYVSKTEEELELIKKERKEKLKMKTKRKQEQDENVKRKKGLGKEEEDKSDKEDEEDDDMEWYRKEVGEEPDPSDFNSQKKKKRESYNPLYKKKKSEGDKKSEGGRKKDFGKDKPFDKKSPGKGKLSGNRSESKVKFAPQTKDKKRKAMDRPKPKGTLFKKRKKVA